ncbi:sensor domain-containing phosphodiesterase [Halopseudomonas pelagia]|uniref:sensor domain-containing phosphodiesterase n=1 Tax=Halopseudomonas pelagia TaxID=553151 RepID=UPI0030DA8890|tara:strand:+ start:64156 stop:65913 length:1758 start_codon:yes stop_codon:yes gene_type:complete
MSVHEQDRLYALKKLNLLDTLPSDSFDRITRMASQLFNLPIAAISLTDENRQWFKSRVGTDRSEIPRSEACDSEVTETSTRLTIPDLLASPRYKNSVLVQSGIRFYAGAPLTTREGYTLGAICVLGNEPRYMTDQELAVLQDLAAMVMDQIELQSAYGRLDPLTGLPNRSQFAVDLQDMSRERQPKAVYVLFSEVVDVASIGSLQRVMGPAYVEELARSAGRLLGKTLPEGGRVYHLGPCQFAHLLIADSDDDVVREAVALREALRGLTTGEAAAVMVRPVVGIARLQLEDQHSGDILRTAHSACLDARLTETGVALYSRELDADHQRRFQMLVDFRAALEQPGQLHLEYQPRISTRSSETIGAEALLRWTHPEWGNISPAEFIPIIEQTQLARPLTEWVMTAAIEQAARWQAQGLDLCMSVNISASNLEETDLVDRLLDAMRQHGLPITSIEVELTESALVDYSPIASNQLDALLTAGIRVAIDDFGTGYSSLAYLQEIPAQVVKIDRSFIQRIEQEKRSRTLVKGMISMAHDLGYSVVAEGVEDHQTYAFLDSLGCDEVQGYFVSRPLPPAQFEQWLEANKPE